MSFVAIQRAGSTIAGRHMRFRDNRSSTPVIVMKQLNAVSGGSIQSNTCIHETQRAMSSHATRHPRQCCYTLSHATRKISDSSETPTASPNHAVRACRHLNAPGLRLLQTDSPAQGRLTPHRLPCSVRAHGSLCFMYYSVWSLPTCI